MHYARLFLTLLAALAATSQSAAQGPPRGDFPFSFGPIGITTVMKEVGLSESQMQQIREIYEKNRHALIDLRAEVQKREGDLQVQLDSEQVDLAKAEPAAKALLAARNRLAETTTMMMLRIRQVFTREQWRRAEELQREIARRPAIAPGPPPGPGRRQPMPGPQPAPQPPPQPQPDIF